MKRSAMKHATFLTKNHSEIYCSEKDLAHKLREIKHTSVSMLKGATKETKLQMTH